jgi:hypothetical protein
MTPWDKWQVVPSCFFIFHSVKNSRTKTFISTDLQQIYFQAQITVLESFKPHYKYKG